jgi:hypothetical protein
MTALGDKVDDGNGGFRGKATCLTPKITIEHEVAEDGNADFTKARQETFEPGNDGGKFVGHRNSGSVGDDGGFLGKHDRKIVPNGIDALAGITFEAGLVRHVADRRFADRANKDGEEFIGNRHWRSPSVKKDFSRDVGMEPPARGTSRGGESINTLPEEQIHAGETGKARGGRAILQKEWASANKQVKKSRIRPKFFAEEE